MTLTRGHDWGDDFAGYILQAESIIRWAPSEFVVQNRFTMQRSSEAFGPVTAPWGLPVMLAPVLRLFDLNMIALKTLNVVCYSLLLIVMALFLREMHSSVPLVLLLSLFAFNTTLLSSLNQLLPDIPFLLFSTSSVLFMGRMLVENRPLTGRIGDRVVLGALVAAAFFLRTNGILLLATLAATQLVCAVRKLPSGSAQGVFCLGAFGIEVVPYVTFGTLLGTWTVLFPQETGFNWRFLATTDPYLILEHATYYFRRGSDFYAGVPLRPLWYVASLPFLAYGVTQSWRRDFPMLLYSGMTIAVFLTWPGLQGLRYLFPVLPFYAHFTLVGLQEVVPADACRLRTLLRVLCLVLPSVLATLLATASSARALHNIRVARYDSTGPFTTEAQAMFDFVRRTTEGGDVVVFFKPRVMRMMTGRSAIMINDPSQISRGDLLCLYVAEDRPDQLAPRAIEDLIAAGQATMKYTNRVFSAYQINK